MNTPARVLVVDDEKSARDTAAALLAADGYELRFAGSGAAALGMLREELPDAIVSDMMMPGMDGLELCVAIKREESWRHVPVIMVTALQTKDHLAQALAAGADDFVSKPVSGVELRARVRSMLRIKRQHDELRDLMRVREDLGHMIVHDMRNPLSVILATADLLASRPSVGADWKKSLDRIQGQAERLNGFLNDMLLLAKLEQGKLVVNRAPTTLREFVAPIEASFRVVAEARGLTFIVIAPASEQVVDIDSHLVSRVVDNLLSNAFKFSPRGADVVLRIEPPATAGGVLRLSVADQGSGIPEDERPRLFQKFSTVAGPMKASQLGLGLAFCKLAVEAHGGRITIADNEPRGAVFVVELAGGPAAVDAVSSPAGVRSEAETLQVDV
jgi:two-component system, sensor histidine kinase and response regulator